MNIKKVKYNSKERESIVSEMNDLLTELNQHIKYLKMVNKTVKKIDSNLSSMEDYYFSNWLDDYNHFKSENHYDVLSQDLIHNALQEIHEEKLKLLKRIVGRLN